MKDYLIDLIQHTHTLGCIELLKITGTDKETQIASIADDKTVIITGTFKTPIPEFKGVFGMPNINKLRIILGFDEYDENAKITVLQKDNNPSTIHFETKNNDFINDYRLMSKNTVEEKIKAVHFKGAVWNVTFAPTSAGILRLKKQANANNEELTFSTKTENNDLKIYFGDVSTHSGNFVFHSGITGTLSKPWHWPVKVFLSIMDLAGDKMIKISDQGACEITVDSGLAEYKYILPAQSK